MSAPELIDLDGIPVHPDGPDRFPQPRAHPFDPPPLYARLGAAQPVRRIVQWNGAPAWFVTRNDLVRALLADARLSVDATHPNYPAQNAALQRVRRDYQVFAQMDPPAHGLERSLFSSDFSAAGIEAIRPRVQDLVDRLIDRMVAGQAPPDLVAGLAAPLPCSVICALLGVPDSDHAQVQGWSAVISSRLTTHEQAAEMTRSFCDGYLTDLVRLKAREPGPDLLSRLMLEQVSTGRLTERKVVSLARLFLTAGHESSTGTLGVGLAALLYHRDQWDALCQNLSLLNGAVEEILRYTDVTHSGRLRVATEDIEIGGVTIRAGEAIVMHQCTANRDPSLYPDPHRFDISRPRRPHLTFGFGIHACVGQMLARLELKMAIGSLAQRLPGLQATEPLEALRFHHDRAIYGLESLPVRW
ncbi:MAG: hypothetical protein RI906_559 [Pseudomonadota bacterium]|jgi:cytochrome P450